MSSSDYPEGFDNIPSVANGDRVAAALENKQSDAINAIETTLGTNPAGSSATVGAAIASKAPLDSPAMIGIPTAPTASGGTSTTQIATTAFVQASAGVVCPAGTVTMYAGSSAPTGWLLCDGGSKLQGDYSGLFAVIGTTYGSVDGTHFNVPNLCGRVVIGVSGSHALASTGGAETHTLSTSEMPSHTHQVPNTRLDDTTTGTGTQMTQYTLGDSGSAGGSQSHNNMQPFLTMNYIIKT